MNWIKKEMTVKETITSRLFTVVYVNNNGEFQLKELEGEKRIVPRYGLIMACNQSEFSLLSIPENTKVKEVKVELSPFQEAAYVIKNYTPERAAKFFKDYEYVLEGLSL